MRQNVTRLSLRMLVLPFLLVGSIMLAGPARAAAVVTVAPAAAVPETRSEPVRATVGKFGTSGVSGVECQVVAWWVVVAAGGRVEGSVSCRTGALEPNHRIEKLTVTGASGCSLESAHIGNDVDDPAQRRFNFVAIRAGGAQPGCSLDQVCIEGQRFGFLVNSPARRQCAAIELGLMPEYSGEAEEYHGSSPVGCVTFNPLIPWVTTPQAVAVSGGWAWRATATFEVPDSRTSAHPSGSSVYPAWVARTSGASVTWARTGSDPGPGNPVRSGGWAADAYYDYRPSGGGWTFAKLRQYEVTGPVHTGSPGSVPLDWTFVGAGYAFTGNGGGGWLNAPNAAAVTSRPSMATLASAGGAFKYVARNDPERCHFWWGAEVFPGDTSGYKAPAGPLPTRDVVTPPAAPPPAADPPVIEFDDDGDGCDPSATLCVDTSEDGPPPLPPYLPDPDDAGDGGSCDFSITNPSTWGGQIICALVSVARMIMGVLDELIGLIGGLVGALLDGLASLFIPDADALSSLIAGLKDSVTAGPVGDWTGAFGDAFGSGGSPGACTGPPVDLSALGAPGVTAVYPFDACTGAAADAAGKVRIVATVGISLGGGWAIIRMFLAALGVNVGVPGRGGRE